jgi:DNA mismatch endonuclease Vsr
MNGLELRTLDLLRTTLGDAVQITAQDSYLPGTPDFVVPTLRLAIFSDGGWFHDNGGLMTRAGLRLRGNGEKLKGDFWLAKANQNRTRDRRVNAELRRLGYAVVRLKESRINSRGALEYVSRAISLSMTSSCGRR